MLSGIKKSLILWWANREIAEWNSRIDKANKEINKESNMNPEPVKRPWTSKTNLAQVAMVALLFLPKVKEVVVPLVQANPEIILTAWGAINVALRYITKGRVSLTD